MEVGDAAANGSGYESDNEDNDEDAPGPRHTAPEPATAAALALAASPDGSAPPHCSQPSVLNPCYTALPQAWPSQCH